MKALVIYDSLYGNTEKVAQAIGGALGAEAKVVAAGQAGTDFTAYDLIVIGSPTQGGRPTKNMQAFLAGLKQEGLKGKRLAAFDTRAKSLVTKLFGWASVRIEAAVREKGGDVIAPPEGFFVKSTKGPLVDGELERAAAWAKKLAGGAA